MGSTITFVSINRTALANKNKLGELHGRVAWDCVVQRLLVGPVGY